MIKVPECKKYLIKVDDSNYGIEICTLKNFELQHNDFFMNRNKLCLVLYIDMHRKQQIATFLCEDLDKISFEVI